MAIAKRTAQTIWDGSLASGKGTITSGTGALGELPVTWAARTQQPDGKTSPEELAAAAHASCFSMALALRLGEHSATPERLDVSATVTLDEVDSRPTVISSELRVAARIPGLEDRKFQSIVREAADLCPISRLFAGTHISVEAILEPALSAV